MRYPAKMNLLDIYKTLTGPVILVDCSTKENLCKKHEGYAGIDIWSKLSSNVDEYLYSVTLDSVVE